MANTVYLIDFNRGSDSNDGISAPWKNLSKITSVTGQQGDQFLLAADSDFDITSRILLNSALGWSSTVANPIRFGVYYPLSSISRKPIIRKRVNIAAGSWTYSAPNNAWAYSATNTISAYAYVKCAGAWATRTDNALPLDSVDGRWSNSGSTLYVYAPSGTNPTDYYGSVTFGGDSSDSAFVVSSPGSVQAFEFSGWQFEECGTGIYVFNSTGSRQYRIHDMVSLNTGAAFYMLTQTAGAVDYEIYDCDLRNGGTALIGAYAIGGLGISRWDVHDNYLSDFNFGFPQGGVYSQVPNGRIHHNEITRANYGVPGKSSDGAAIYTETGADNNVVEYNYIHDTYLACQDNCGRTSIWRGNIISDCFAACKITDASTHQAVNFSWVENTVRGAGNPITPGAGSVAGVGVLAFTETTPGMIFNCQNNIFTAYQGVTPQYAFELPQNATGSIDRTNTYGFAGTVERYGGGAAPIVATRSIVGDPDLSATFMPRSVDVIAAGAVRSEFDFYGNRYGIPPSLGAVQFGGSNTLQYHLGNTGMAIERPRPRGPREYAQSR